MHSDLGEPRRWISEDRFRHALNFCMLLPGPEALQLAIYVGCLLHGVAGGLAAGVLFVLPSVFVLLGLSWLYAAHGELPAIAAALWGLKPIVLAILLEAVPRIGRRALRGLPYLGIAAAAFVAVRSGLPFPLVVLAAAGLGLLVGERKGKPAEEATRPTVASKALETFVLTRRLARPARVLDAKEGGAPRVGGGVYGRAHRLQVRPGS